MGGFVLVRVHVEILTQYPVWLCRVASHGPDRPGCPDLPLVCSGQAHIPWRPSMKRINLPLFAGCVLALSLLLSTSSLLAEALADFSGKWSFIKAKSKASEGTSFSESEVNLDIKQSQESITIIKTIKNNEGKIDTTIDEYVLDGKQRITNDGSVETKRTNSWSADRKQVILVQTLTLGPRVYTTKDVYSLSDNGNALTIRRAETMDKRKSNEVQVYNRK
jgi:hypothetical protein